MASVCVKYVENFRWVRLNGKKEYVGKFKFLLQSKNADFTNFTHFLFMVVILFIYTIQDADFTYQHFV